MPLVTHMRAVLFKTPGALEAPQVCAPIPSLRSGTCPAGRGRQAAAGAEVGRVESSVMDISIEYCVP